MSMFNMTNCYYCEKELEHKDAIREQKFMSGVVRIICKQCKKKNRVKKLVRLRKN